jgi:hypothetical protein
MKKTITLFSFVTLFLFTFGQTVDRDKVIVEIGTGTGCPYCPGAAMGAEDLVANGKQVGVIEYHNYNSGDPYNNSYAAARCSYYGISGYPTAIFDGTLYSVGGSYSNSLYTTYLPKYNQRISIPSDFSISIDGNSPTGEEYNVSITVNNVNNNTQSNLRLQVVVTESEIPYNWQGQNHLSFVERLMLPNHNGTTLDFSSGNSFTKNFNFALGSDWDYEHCQLVVFVQNHSTKEILQGSVIDLPDLIVPLDYNASINSVYVPRTLCNEQITPKAYIKNGGNITMTSLDISYQINDGEEVNFEWTGSLELGEGEMVELPTSTLENILETNTINISVSNPNGNPDQYANDNSSSYDFVGSDDFPNPPNIVIYVKTDDHPEQTTWEIKGSDGTVLQSGGPYTLPSHLYTENIDITENGCYSFVIYDAGGDGLIGISSKYIITENGNIYFTNGEFGYMEETQFTVGQVGIENNLLGNNFQVYPNPVSQTAFIMYQTNKTSNVQINLYNSLGVLVLTQNEENQTAGVHSVEIDGKKYQEGIYFVDLIIGETHYKKKIVVVK